MSMTTAFNITGEPKQVSVQEYLELQNENCALKQTIKNREQYCSDTQQYVELLQKRLIQTQHERDDARNEYYALLRKQ